MLAFHNARLVRVSGGGFSGNYARPAGVGDAKWEGDEDALLRDEALERTGVRTEGSDNLVDQLTETTLTVALLADLAIATGDTVTVVKADVESERRVAGVVVDDALGEIRIRLEDA